MNVFPVSKVSDLSCEDFGLLLAFCLHKQRLVFLASELPSCICVWVLNITNGDTHLYL